MLSRLVFGLSVRFNHYPSCNPLYKYGHFWFQMTKKSVAITSVSMLQNGSPPTNGCRHSGPDRLQISGSDHQHNGTDTQLCRSRTECMQNYLTYRRSKLNLKEDNYVNCDGCLGQKFTFRFHDHNLHSQWLWLSEWWLLSTVFLAMWPCFQISAINLNTALSLQTASESSGSQKIKMGKDENKNHVETNCLYVM